MVYSLTAELFSELAVGILVFGIRFFARWKLVGFHKFWYDDLFAGIAVVSTHHNRASGSCVYFAGLGFLGS